MWPLLLVTIGTFWFHGCVFLPWNETRWDLRRLSDVVHDRLPVANLNGLVHLSMGSCVLYYAWQMCWYFDRGDVEHLLLGLTLLFGTRTVMMALCPLRAPLEIRQLHDPVWDRLSQGRAGTFANDLFFSGHVSTLVLLGLTSKHGAWWFWANALLTVWCMLLGRVHYTVDMLVAPYIAFGTHHVTAWLLGE